MATGSAVPSVEDMTQHPLPRRTVLRLGLAGAAAAFAPALGACSTIGGVVGSVSSGGPNTTTESSAGELLRSTARLPEPFRVPLPVPPVLRPARSDADTDSFELTQRAARVEILPGLRTGIWGYDGMFPGPTVVTRRGRRAVLTHRNELPVPVAVHLHGGVVAPEHDGYPSDVIFPAGGSAPAGHAGHGSPIPLRGPTGSRDYVYDLDQPAATLWYHDHRLDFTGPQVWRGLAGFHLQRDDHEDSLGLPSGEREVPLMITDRSFGADGELLYPALDPTLTGTPGVTHEFSSGVLGDCILVNGRPWPVLEVAAVRYRFRLLNASNARRYRLRLDDGTQLVQIGSDQGLLAAPVAHDEIDIAQAERFDVVVDFSGRAAGDEVTLVNDFGSDGTENVMRFRVTGPAEDPSRVPDRLADVETLSPADVVTEREIVFARGSQTMNGMAMWTVNGMPFGPDHVVARPALGSVERWRIRGLNVEHPFHIHLAPFQVETREDGPPGPYDGGWKDTVSLDNGGWAEILIRFDGFRGRYVLHCHNLEHEDMMMMANFDVV